MGLRRSDRERPRVKGTSWCWVWLDGDHMPLHQDVYQGFIVQELERHRRDDRGEYVEHWLQVLVRTQPGAEPVVAWVPDWQVKREGEHSMPPLLLSDRTAGFDTVQERRRRAAERRGY